MDDHKYRKTWYLFTKRKKAEMKHLSILNRCPAVNCSHRFVSSPIVLLIKCYVHTFNCNKCWNCCPV